MIQRDQLVALGIDADRWGEPLNSALVVSSITTDARMAMFLAQCAHESGAFRHLVESLNYSAAALVATWPNRFNEADAAAMARDEVRIGERAYGGRMGNGPEGSGDGFKFRGRGIIQITGRENYGKCGAALGLNLLEHPELLEEPAAACASAGWYWLTHGCNELADAGDFEGITRRINGGLNGLADRQAWLTKVYHALGTQAPAPIEDRSPPPLRQRKGTSMGMIALPLLAQLIPQVLGLFSQRAQATIAEKTGADPKLAGDFMQAMIAQVGHAVGVPVVDDASATQAVAALTAAPTEDRAAKVAALEAQALAQLDALLKAGDKAAAWDAAMWDAQNKGRQVVSSIAIEERRAGIWDMTQTVVTKLLVMLWGIAWGLLGAIIWLAVSGKADTSMAMLTALVGLAGPIWTGAIVTSVAAIVGYRFDGSKQSSDQSKALNEAIRQRSQQ